MTTNLPGIFVEKQDGGLNVAVVSNAPKILIIGTASDGPSENPWVVTRAQESAVLFGSSGTLTRGMYEVKAGGGENLILFRIGATSAILEGIGNNASTGGITVETSTKDNTAADDYSLYWDNTDHRLVVKNVESDTIVYDRDFDDPRPTIDLGEVYVSGTFSAGQGVDIGDQYDYKTLTEVAAGAFTCTLTNGTDGTSPSRMEMYENLFKAYDLLENRSFDIVVPMDVYLDDDNVADGDTYSASPSTTYPTAGDTDDILLYFYAEKYQGEWYFWWRKTKTTGAADIYPTGYQTTSPGGVTIATTAFHEVNFAYQLASFCYNVSKNSNECRGHIGVKPPNSLSIADTANWIGELPTYTLNSDTGLYTITNSGDNGSGLLGNKWMAGKYGFRAGAAYGGFIGTDDGYLDGTEEEDRGGEVIDIGQYISVSAMWVTLYNAFDTSGLGYVTTLAPTYAGFESGLDSKEAPTNKVLSGVTIPIEINNADANDLITCRYIIMQAKSKGNVIVDAPTAALPTSDYARLTTVKICKDFLDALRDVCDPFIGRADGAGGALGRAAMETECNKVAARFQQNGYLSLKEPITVTATPAQRVAGVADVHCVIVPAFEIRQINLILALRPV